MSQLYDTLKLYDPSIAQLYFDATGDRTNAKITRAAAEKIFKQVLSEDWLGVSSITDKEAEALTHLLLFGKFDVGVKEYLKTELSLKSEKIESSPLNNLLTKIAYALTRWPSSQIQFVSPKTNIAYSPSQFAAIYQLIQDGEIAVRALPGGSHSLNYILTGSDGVYRSDLDQITLPDMSHHWHGLYVLVVHEATHAIQDWLDVDAPVWFIETDAYIAGAIAAQTINSAPLTNKDHPEHVAFDQVGLLRKNGQWKLIGQDFEKVWKKVFSAVRVHPLYKDKEKQKTSEVKDQEHLNWRGQGVSEKEVFEKLVAAAKGVATKP